MLISFDDETDDTSTGHVSLSREDDVEGLMWEVFFNEGDYNGSYPVEDYLTLNPVNRCIEYDPKCPRYDLPVLVVNCDNFVKLLANKNVSFWAQKVSLTGNKTENISKTTKHLYDAGSILSVEIKITEENTYPEWRNIHDIPIDLFMVNGIHLTDDYDYNKPVVIGGRKYPEFLLNVKYNLMYEMQVDGYYDDRERKLDILVQNIYTEGGVSSTGCTLSLKIDNTRANTLWPPIPYGLTLRNIEDRFYELLNSSKTDGSYSKLAPYFYKLDGYGKIGYLGADHKYGTLYDTNDNGACQIIRCLYSEWEEIPPGMNEEPITRK